MRKVLIGLCGLSLAGAFLLVRYDRLRAENKESVVASPVPSTTEGQHLKRKTEGLGGYLELGPQDADSSIPVISSKFLQAPPIGNSHFKKFVLRQDLEFPIPGSDRVVAVWQDDGFESITFVLGIGKRTGSNFASGSKADLAEIETVLDRALTVGIGSVKIHEIHRDGEKQHLIIGESSGGDGGDGWGSIWIGRWLEPRQFKILHQENHQASETKRENLSYKYDPSTRSLHFTKMTEKCQQEVCQKEDEVKWDFVVPN